MADNIPLEWGILFSVVLTAIWLLMRRYQDNKKDAGGED